MYNIDSVAPVIPVFKEVLSLLIPFTIQLLLAAILCILPAALESIFSSILFPDVLLNTVNIVEFSGTV
jgi:hypothetical protein